MAADLWIKELQKGFEVPWLQLLPVEMKREVKESSFRIERTSELRPLWGIVVPAGGGGNLSGPTFI